MTVERANGTIRVKGNGELKPVDVITMPYPGFPTDMQAQMSAVMTVTPGISVITEKVFPNRFMHISEMARLGADCSLEGSSAIVKGVKRLSGAPVMASDLRASAGLVLAGLCADGETEVNRIYHVDRGYERIDQKLRQLGRRSSAFPSSHEKAVVLGSDCGRCLRHVEVSAAGAAERGGPAESAQVASEKALKDMDKEQSPTP